MVRKPNCACIICGKGLYRRPVELEKNPHRKCATCYLPRLEFIKCKSCNIEFKPSNIGQVFCSRRCSGKGRRLGTYTKDKLKNIQQRRMGILREAFNFDTCMIEGCNYDVIFDLHRHIPGREGGEYVVGNMFAICPNHHAEVTRRLIRLEKVTDCLLRVGS